MTDEHTKKIITFPCDQHLKKNEMNYIIKTVNEVREKFNYVFTTGGIGPTHDDITSRSIAKAFNLSYGYHKAAYTMLEKYYGRNEFNVG